MIIDIINIKKEEYYKSDIIDLREYPDEDVRKVLIPKEFKNVDNYIFRLDKLNTTLSNEAKEYIEYIVTGQAPNKKFKGSYLFPFNRCIDFLNQYKYESILDYDDSIITNDFIDYLTQNGYNTQFDNRNALVAFKTFTKNRYYDKNNISIYDRDIIYIKDLGLTDERVNKSNRNATIRFIDILNKENKKLIKNFVKYLIRGTDLSLTSIIQYRTNIGIFLKYIGDKNLSDIARKDVEDYFEYLNSLNYEGRTFDTNVSHCLKFCEYLVIKKEITSNYFYTTDFKNPGYKYKFSAIDKSVINSIFNIIDQLPEEYMIMYFILYCTGMRISELCQLKVDCLAVIKNKYLIKYYQPKMKKEVFNPIPEALYYLIEKRANSLVENKSEYLFPSPANKNIPMSRQYFTEEMQELLKPFNIKKPDGSEYIFRAHDYRHTIATDLLERDIPTHIIQKALHHESPEMTLAYAEYRDDRRRRKFKEFVNIRGEYEPIKDYITEEVYITTEWIRSNIRAQALPNGFCGIPVKMGECPNANACLECDYFRTTVQHLAIHKKHLAQTEIILEKSIQNGWLAQIETNQKVKQNLINIINKLELELKEGGCHNETKKS